MRSSDPIAAVHGLPATDDARLIDGDLAPQILGLDAPRMHRARPGGGDQVLVLGPGGVGEGHPDTVAEAAPDPAHPTPGASNTTCESRTSISR